MKIFLGLDPGSSGGLVALLSGGEVESCISMPATDRDVWEWIVVWSYGRGYETFAVLEKVNSMPGEGHQGAFKFGTSVGSLRMALVAAGIPFEEVRSQEWQHSLGIPKKKQTESKTQWKNRLKNKAQQLFPRQKVTLSTADALLMAEYCRRSRLALEIQTE